MTNPFSEIVIGEAPLVAPPTRFSDAAGAVLDFWGVVRGREANDFILGIDYEAHLDMARHQLEAVAQEAASLYAIHGLTLHHRIGFVPTGEPSLFLRVSAGHRGPAFAAGQWIIEELKRRVPIWKRPVPLTSAPASADNESGGLLAVAGRNVSGR